MLIYLCYNYLCYFEKRGVVSKNERFYYPDVIQRHGFFEAIDVIFPINIHLCYFRIS